MTDVSSVKEEEMLLDTSAENPCQLVEGLLLRCTEAFPLDFDGDSLSDFPAMRHFQIHAASHRDTAMSSKANYLIQRTCLGEVKRTVIAMLESEEYLSGFLPLTFLLDSNDMLADDFPKRILDFLNQKIAVLMKADASDP